MLGKKLLSNRPLLMVLSQLGEGGFGTVYKAATAIKDGAYVDFVAVKAVRRREEKGSKAAKKREKAQLKEAGVLTSLPPHRHILTANSVHLTDRWGADRASAGAGRRPQAVARNHHLFTLILILIRPLRDR